MNNLKLIKLFINLCLKLKKLKIIFTQIVNFVKVDYRSNFMKIIIK